VVWELYQICLSAHFCRFVSHEAIVIEYSIRGTHGIFNNIPPSGRAVELPATVIYEFDDEARLSQMRYIDITPLLNEAKLRDV